jgi:hypothetical protein
VGPTAGVDALQKEIKPRFLDWPLEVLVESSENYYLRAIVRVCYMRICGLCNFKELENH